MRKHVKWLYFFDHILVCESFQVSCLCGGIAADIYNAFWPGLDDSLYYIAMHTCPRWIGDDHIRNSMIDKHLPQVVVVDDDDSAVGAATSLLLEHEAAATTSVSS